jgi:integrase
LHPSSLGSGVVPRQPLRELSYSGALLKYLGQPLELDELLNAVGKLRVCFSVHDLRKAFAVRIYHETRDVYAVEKALSDANVAVTETYLRFLGLVRGITIRQVFRYTLIPRVFR